MTNLVVAARITLALIFLTSAGAKLRFPSTLAQAIQQYGGGLIGPTLARHVARLLPPFELLLGLLFLCGLWLTATACAALGALGIFTLAMAANLAQGRRFRCNCFGTASSEIGVGSLSRNVLLIAASLFVLLSSPWVISATAAFRNDANLLSEPTTVAIVLASCSAYVMVLAVGEIDSLFRSHRVSRKGV